MSNAGHEGTCFKGSPLLSRGYKKGSFLAFLPFSSSHAFPLIQSHIQAQSTHIMPLYNVSVSLKC